MLTVDRRLLGAYFTAELLKYIPVAQCLLRDIVFGRVDDCTVLGAIDTTVLSQTSQTDMIKKTNIQDLL